ncbi:penicillin-binding protein, partial [Bacillus thuringiensis]|nr:penicillin-binding protein [Bacillus thuringiensis]
MLKKWLIVFFIFAVFCGSVVTLIHANKGKKYDTKAFSNVNSKQKDVKQEVDANEKKRYEIAAGKLDQYLKDKGFNGSVLVASKDHV